MDVEVIDIHELNVGDAKSAGSLKAYVTIRIGPLTIYRIKLIEQPGQKAYVSPPQLEYYAQGRVTYVPVVRWPQDWHERIFTAVMTAYHALHVEKTNTPEPRLPKDITTYSKEN